MEKNTTEQAFQQYSEAKRELIIAIVKSLYLDRFVDWLNRKLTK